MAPTNGLPPLARYGPTEKVNGLPGTPPSGHTSFAAYELARKKQAQLKSRAWKIWLVGGDCLLIGLAPVLVHMAKDSSGRFAFSPMAVNLLVEICKVAFALATLVIYGTGQPGPPMYASARSFARDASHNRLLAVPAALYAVNNYLKFAMQLYFKPTTAKMLSNLKILMIAVLMRSVLKRRFTVVQWEALYLLVAGITVNQLNYCTKGGGGDVLAPAAIAYTLGSITIPSLASVYNEFALKKHMDTSVLLQNFFLYFYGMCFNLLGLLGVMAAGALTPATMFTGFRLVTCLLVVNNALQGILSSFFFKYADTILKKYSSTIATILTGVLSAALFGHALTLNFMLGVSVVFISMHLFFTMGGSKGAARGADGGGGPSKGHHAADPAQRGQLAVSPSMDHMSMGVGTAPGSVTSLSSASIASMVPSTFGGDTEAGVTAASMGHRHDRPPPVLPR